MSQPKVLWTAEESAELFRLLALGVKCAAAAATLNSKFGTGRSRKSCASHLYDLGHRSKRGPQKPWPAEHDEILRARDAAGVSFSKIAIELNAQFGTAYTRNSCIGRRHRMDEPRKPRRLASVPKEVQAAKCTVRRREKRWAADPSLKEKYERVQEMKRNRKTFVANGASKTSAIYRNHRPKIAHMTRGELRAMLAQAFQNTAAMEIAA